MVHSGIQSTGRCAPHLNPPITARANDVILFQRLRGGAVTGSSSLRANSIWAWTTPAARVHSLWEDLTAALRVRSSTASQTLEHTHTAPEKKETFSAETSV